MPKRGGFRGVSALALLPGQRGVVALRHVAVRRRRCRVCLSLLWVAPFPRGSPVASRRSARSKPSRRSSSMAPRPVGTRRRRRVRDAGFLHGRAHGGRHVRLVLPLLVVEPVVGAPTGAPAGVPVAGGVETFVGPRRPGSPGWTAWRAAARRRGSRATACADASAGFGARPGRRCPGEGRPGDPGARATRPPCGSAPTVAHWRARTPRASARAPVGLPRRRSRRRGESPDRGLNARLSRSRTQDVMPGARAGSAAGRPFDV